MKRIIGFLVIGMLLTSILTGCGDNAEPDDYVTNIGYEVAVDDTAAVESTSGTVLLTVGFVRNQSEVFVR